MHVAGDFESVLGWGGTFPSNSALSNGGGEDVGAMLLNSGWHSPLPFVQDREAGDGAASAWFGCEINLEEKHSYPIEII